MRSTPINRAVRALLVYLVVSLHKGHGLCPSKNGTVVDWWIIYQQRSMPFFHFYVDSTSNSDISFHKPESPDSVLSKAADLIIDGVLPQYFLYSYDLINLMRVSKTVTFPMYSKWMQGILASDRNTENGFWILHNNFLFPAISNGKLQPPTSSSWRSVTIGDSSEDLFYVCLSLETRENLLDSVKNILAGNPFIYHKKLTDLKLEEYFTEITEKNHPFSLLASANAYMECLTATKEAQRHRCMYQFATKNVRSIQVYTRPRGLMQGGRKFCYGHQTSALFEFSDLDDSGPTNAISSNNMFVISDEVTSERYGVVCFGQDIAATSDTVAVMICGKLPGLWRTMVQASQLTNWGCPNHGLGEKGDVKQMQHMHKPHHHGIPSPLTQSFTAQVKTPEVRRLKRDTTSQESSTKTRQLRSKRNTNKKRRRSKREAPEDEEREESFEHPKKKDVDFKKSQNGHEKFLKYEEREDAGKDKSNSKLERYMEIKMPVEKPSREKEPPKTVIRINTLDELQKSVVENENQLIAIFCRKGCRYCAATEPKFQMLIDHFKKEHVDFFHVDVGEIDMPYQLAVEWTPYVRFKPRGVTQLSPYEWKEFSGEEYNFRTMYQFLDDHLEKMEGNIKMTRTSRG
ncbi:uncharacterized protein LOC125649412 [Ostrea edulis]|uniref:uncharacterized protein LOC125649412 n=1 Tax=Ostrea edulis TaxID=37623 RepID=UPI0024AF5854|nr:uncharacterized protein LOC125649412 [Ostrea edulis]